MQDSENTDCNAGCNGSRIAKGEETLGDTEVTIEATKNDDAAGPFGGRSQAQPGQVRRIH